MNLLHLLIRQYGSRWEFNTPLWECRFGLNQGNIMAERSLEDYNLASETYHRRFMRLCKEMTENITAWDKFRIGWQGRVPPEFLVDEAPMLHKFLSLYEEFRECMIDIGENQKTLAVHTKEYIATLEELNEINEKIISSIQPEK